jgi:hypothetical protein
MQRGSAVDPMRERIHQLHERNRVTVRGVEDLALVSRSGRGEQGRGGIELMEVVLQRLARTGPVRPAETKGGAISAQISALRAVHIAEAHDAGGQRTRQRQRFALKDGLDRRAQRLRQAGPALDGMHEGKARVDEHRRAVRSGRAHRAARSGKRGSGEIFPGVPVVQQRVRLLPGNVDVEVLGAARPSPPREDATQFGARSGDRHVHGVHRRYDIRRRSAQRLDPGERAEFPSEAQPQRSAGHFLHSVAAVFVQSTLDIGAVQTLRGALQARDGIERRELVDSQEISVCGISPFTMDHQSRKRTALFQAEDFLVVEIAEQRQPRPAIPSLCSP